MSLLSIKIYCSPWKQDTKKGKALLFFHNVLCSYFIYKISLQQFVFWKKHMMATFPSSKLHKILQLY